MNREYKASIQGANLRNIDLAVYMFFPSEIFKVPNTFFSCVAD